jgi:hypothetical protein
VRDIDPDAVHSAVEPEPEHVRELRPYGRMIPVEVWLFWREQVQVPVSVRQLRPRGPWNMDCQLLGGESTTASLSFVVRLGKPRRK